MADFVIKPTTGNLKIQDDQDVDRIVIAPTTGVTTLSNPTLTAPTITNLSNVTGTLGSGVTLPVQSGHVLQVVQYALASTDTGGMPTRSSVNWGGFSTDFHKSITITSGNSILIQVSLTASRKAGGQLLFRLWNDSESEYVGTEGADQLFGAHVHDDAQFNNINHTRLYTPSSGTTHDIHVYTYNFSTRVQLNGRAYETTPIEGRCTSTIILSEIAA